MRKRRKRRREEEEEKEEEEKEEEEGEEEEEKRMKRIKIKIRQWEKGEIAGGEEDSLLVFPPGCLHFKFSFKCYYCATPHHHFPLL